MSDQDLRQRLELARQIAVSAGNITLNFFRTPDLGVEIKSDGSPLTQADQQCELALREAIAREFPQDGIVGEEYGSASGTSGWDWILDPIDGTKAFVAGVPLYGTMVAAARNGRADVGVLFFPGLQQGIFAGRGLGAWYFDHQTQPRKASVSRKSKLSRSIFVTSAVETFNKRNAKPVYERMADSVFFARTWGDAYGYMMVALGQVDIQIDPILKIWDAAAVQPIIEEAGGQFSDWSGRPKIDSGDSLATNGLLHDEVLRILATAPPYEHE
jgi:histidinol phosphatase-like enzyme (inositol monophosphatase family)